MSNSELPIVDGVPMNKEALSSALQNRKIRNHDLICPKRFFEVFGSRFKRCVRTFEGLEPLKQYTTMSSEELSYRVHLGPSNTVDLAPLERGMTGFGKEMGKEFGKEIKEMGKEFGNSYLGMGIGLGLGCWGVAALAKAWR